MAPPLVAPSGRPLLGAGSRLLLGSPPDASFPGIVPGPADLLFDMTVRRPGVPAVNDQFERFGEPRTWEANWTHPEGFCGVRWQPTWMRADGFYGSWEPAEGEVFRIRRKGASGQDAQTLVVTMGPNPAPVPVGDSLVVWEVDGYDGGVKHSSALALSGWNLPLRSKLTVTACAPSAPWDDQGRREVEVDAGTALPAIDWTVPSYDSGGGWMQQTVRARHWSFFVDASEHRLRWPLPWFRDNSLDLVLPNGGYVMLGGLQHRPVWRDWTIEYWDFGASLTEDLWRQECEGLAYWFGGTDPRRLAVELENEPTRPWRDTADGPGYGRLLAEVWYPVARAAWGMERTLGVKATSFGSVDSLRDDFDWTNPTGHNTFLCAHNYDGQFHLGPGGRVATWGSIGETDYAADMLASRIAQYGFAGGGFTEFGTNRWEWWDAAATVADDERGRRLGRGLTSLAARGLSQWVWGLTGDGYNCCGIYDMGGGQMIESAFPGMRPYCMRAGRTTT